MLGKGPTTFPCVLCNKRTKKRDRRKIIKSVSKYLEKYFMLSAKSDDTLCNKCGHNYYVHNNTQNTLFKRDRSVDEDYVPTPKRKSSCSLSSPPSVSLQIPCTSKSHSFCFVCKKPGPKKS